MSSSSKLAVLEQLASEGQSLWLDYIRRGMTRSGDLERMVGIGGVRGVTSNPSIFQKAIAGSDDYRSALETLVGRDDLDAQGVYEALAVQDIQEAADVLRPLYDETRGGDGFVSLEVAPGLAHDTVGTIADARRLWSEVGRPNLMIKVPGTPEGITALEELIAEGINVNVTLIFARATYEEIAAAHLRGLQKRVDQNLSVDRVASVASFFVSRIDTEVDKALEGLTGDASKAELARSLQGKIAVANAKLAYRSYQRLIESDAWKSVAAKGAKPQRLLWASTGTKNPAYSDVLYVDELIGPDTVNTVPPATLEAFEDHGNVEVTLTRDVDDAAKKMEQLAKLGVSLDRITDDLLDKGLELFAEAMDDLLATVASIQRGTRGPRLNRMQTVLPGKLGEDHQQALATWDEAGNTTRLWKRDASLWTDSGEQNWLGWLDIVAQQQKNTASFTSLPELAKTQGIQDVILLGMGGSSLWPDVMAQTFGSRTKTIGAPRLSILDSTVPAAVRSAHARVDMKKTLVVVASKSGSTLEPTVFLESFLDRARNELGDAAGSHFIAITDPGSKLEAFAKEHGFRSIFHGVPEIGGRFSALSNFGIVPAALMGLDASAMLDEASLMVEACRRDPAGSNPGVALGVLLGTAAKQGRDKLTVVTSPAISSFGAWLEQLVAESTGKGGKAIIPVESEPLGKPAAYGNDRIFVYLRLRSTPDAGQDRRIDALRSAGAPVVTLELDDIDALPQEVFRWEVATAVAGAILELNPFDQPDVEASKVAAKKVMAQYESSGSLPSEDPVFEDDGIALFTDAANADAMGRPDSLVGWLAAHVGRIRAGDYAALLAYLEMNAEHAEALGRLRAQIFAAKGCATCVGFGPRFLHSTGQAYKGGPNTGVFLQLTAEGPDLDIPGRPYGFSVVASAQAGGDLRVLFERERRALRVHLGSDVRAGLARLEQALAQALKAR